MDLASIDVDTRGQCAGARFRVHRYVILEVHMKILFVYVALPVSVRVLRLLVITNTLGPVSRVFGPIWSATAFP